jgi:hypothetical protein
MDHARDIQNALVGLGSSDEGDAEDASCVRPGGLKARKPELAPVLEEWSLASGFQGYLPLAFG